MKILQRKFTLILSRVSYHLATPNLKLQVKKNLNENSNVRFRRLTLIAPRMSHREIF